MSVGDGEILRVVASLLWDDGGINQNVFNCVVTGGSPPYDDQDIVDDMEDWLDDMYGNLTATITDNLDGNEVIVYKYDHIDDDWDEVGSQAFTWNPTTVLEYLPRGVAGLVRLWTTDPDVQGRKYIGGLTEGAIVDGLLQAGTLTALLNFAADWYAPTVGAASGATITPGIWSVAGTVFKLAVDHVAASAIPAYQRRRKRNVGI
jgi:hypothetical protein